MPSVLIAAHDEEAVIGACLDALNAQEGVEGLEVIVSANACSDRTADIAARHGALVLDRPEPGKALALNAGERAATSFPRIYLDADIVPPAHAVAALVALLEQPGTLAAVPRRRLNTTGRPWPVKAYFAINERLPAFRDGLFGRGMIAVSEQGRARFTEFPAMVADDLFLDSQFTDAEKAQAESIDVVIEAPYTTGALVRRLVRVRRGNTDMRAALGRHIRPSDRWAWLRDVILPHPRLAGAAIPYVLITVWAGLQARRSSAGRSWGRDDSTRQTPSVPQKRAS
jgi:glycosyltransferase involved in cell wall biosynthesis